MHLYLQKNNAMKKILCFLILLITAAGCEKSDFLKESPEGNLVVGNFYTSESDAKAAVASVYNLLYSIYDRYMILLNDLPTDDEKNGLGMPNQFLQDLEYLRHTSENTFVRDMWGFNYSGISRANTAIVNINQMSVAAISDAAKAKLIAEASFLRALYYFNLVRFYGDVPLLTQLNTLQDALIPRTAASEVYAQIIADLQNAESNLPATYAADDVGHATSGAAKILLGKVYLTMHDYQSSADKIAEVINNESTYGYGLNENFAANWELGTETGKEMVFTVQSIAPPGHINNQMSLEGPKYSVTGGGGVPGIAGANEADIPTIDLYQKYIDGDTRKDKTFKLDYVSPSNGQTYTSSIPLFGKYWQEGLSATLNCEVNMHIIRYSDALLMYAEALNELGRTTEALTYLNRVRERAFHNSDHNYTGLTKDDCREKIYLERRLEFANEGQRWFDLVRTGRLFETMKAHGQLEAQLAESNKTTITDNARDYQQLYPVPQRELDLNDLLDQNPGW